MAYQNPGYLDSIVAIVRRVGSVLSGIRFDVSNITSGTIRTWIFPDASSTVVGTDTTQILTNKTLTSSTNNIAATSLLTSTPGVVINYASSPPPPGSGYVPVSNGSGGITYQLFTSSTPNTVYVNNNGAILNFSNSGKPIYRARGTSNGGTVVFNVTTDGTSGGPAIFPNLATGTCKLVTAEANVTSSQNVPLASIRSTVGNTVTVNVVTGTNIVLGVLGPSLIFAPNGTIVYIEITAMQ